MIWIWIPQESLAKMLSMNKGDRGEPSSSLAPDKKVTLLSPPPPSYPLCLCVIVCKSKEAPILWSTAWVTFLPPSLTTAFALKAGSPYSTPVPVYINPYTKLRTSCLIPLIWIPFAPIPCVTCLLHRCQAPHWVCLYPPSPTIRV